MIAVEGIRVLDLSRLLPGPYASLVLADLGAEVDKLEDVAGGDYLRHMPPLTRQGAGGGESGMFVAINRNKRSLSLDLKHPAGREAFLKLLPRYDVLLEQFRPGVLARLGLAHETLRALHPRLVICALTGYGQTGPLARRAGHDLNYLARGGVLGMQGPSDGPAQVPGVQIADIGGALFAVIGILAALRRRDQNGEGGVVDVSMMEAAMGFASAGFGCLFADAELQRGRETLTGGLSVYRTYLTKDSGQMALAALEPKFAAAFCSALGVPFDESTLLPGPHQKELEATLSRLFAERTRAEWEAFSEEHDACLEPVLTPAEAMRDAHVNARGIFFDLTTPEGVVPQMRTPLTSKERSHRRPPRQGEHTREILREAGLDDAAIDGLVTANVARVSG